MLPTRYQRHLSCTAGWWGANEDRFVYEEDAGIGFEVDTGALAYGFEAFDSYVGLVGETESY